MDFISLILLVNYSCFGDGIVIKPETLFFDNALSTIPSERNKNYYPNIAPYDPNVVSNGFAQLFFEVNL
jgi:hypothetical protein